MGGWEDRIWRDKDAAVGVPYRSRVPSLIAGMQFRLDELTLSAARDCEHRIREWCDDPLSVSCDLFLQMMEAAGSSEIEGIIPSPRRLAHAQVSGVGERPALAVLSNIAAVSKALEIGLAAGALTVDDICAVHIALTEELPYYPRADFPPGEIRTTQNWIGGGGRAPLMDDVGPARLGVKFVPPGPELVEPLLEDLLAFAARTDLPRVPQAAVFHARFEEIHPFADGNGRTGRALVHALWAKQGLLTRHVTIPLSSRLARHAHDYEMALREFQHHEHPNGEGLDVAALPIVAQFLNATSEALTRAAEMTHQLNVVLRGWLERVKPQRGSFAERLLANLPAHPIVETRSLAERYGVTQRQAARVVRDLEREGILVRSKIAGLRQAYEAPELLNVAATPSALHAETTLEPATRPANEARHGHTHDRGDTPVRQRRRRERKLCGKYMPLADATCVLTEGHAGGHRATLPWGG